MPVGLNNIDANLKGMIAGSYPDIGQTAYLVNSDYRTVAQGWSRADRTGPLDLAEARRAGPGGVQYVFRTADYGTHTLALQAAHDSTVAYRGDALFFTPGNYTPLTAVTITNNAVRLLGQPRGRQNGNTTITAGVTLALTIGSAVSDVEIGFLRFVPITAGTTVGFTGASNNAWIHDVQTDARGITLSTSTIAFGIAGVQLNTLFERVLSFSDTAIGATVVVSAAVAVADLWLKDFVHYHGANTLAVSTLDSSASSTATGMVLENFRGMKYLTGAVTAVCKTGNHATDTVHLSILNARCNAGWPTAAGFVSSTGAAAEWNIDDSRLMVASGTASAGTTTPSPIYTA